MSTTWNWAISRSTKTWIYDDEFLFLFFNLDIFVKNSTTGELANNRQSDRVAKMALKFQRTRGHFLSDVFVAVTRKIKHHVYGKREYVLRDQVWTSDQVLTVTIYLSFTVHYNYTIIGKFTSILSIRIVLNCFYLLIYHFEHFSTWISRLP